jgi:hypothetical protein
VVIWILRTSTSTFDFNTHIPASSSCEASSTPEKLHTHTPQPSPTIAVPHTPKKVAAIIETRPLDTWIPLILHFSTVLGPEWPIHIFTTQTQIPSSIPLRRALASKRIEIRPLPPNSEFTNHEAVSEFLTTSWFWEQLAPADHVLLFQADSIICANSPLTVDDFLQYDFVGAPIDLTLGHGDEGMNGGLSLRNRALMLEIILRYSWKEEVAKADEPVSPQVLYEDQWFFHKLRDMGARIPNQDEASRFSVETMWYENPVGYHQIGKWNMDRVESIDLYCPEHRLATNVFL